ncbi:MAG: dihydroxyacetone kinase subunit L [Synergistaceae bacterium]|jgi:dihydroxyacetone kinase-like protein|nr:dihydroxyacetone kinase subunit L [Synergistaceae bacterium]
MAFTLEMARDAINRYNAILEEKRDYLTDLDTVIGDADHGINMSRGLRRAAEKIAAKEFLDFGGFFREVAVTVMSAVGGSAGPLYGTFFMKMGQNLTSRREASIAELADAMAEGLSGIMALGKSAPGDKTMIEALDPAIQALKKFSEDGDSAAWNMAVKAAEAGMKDTIPMRSKRGRSSYLGERSMGCQDPGATSSYYMIACMRDASLE